MPLRFRANVTLFPSGCFPTPRPKNELPKIFTQALGSKKTVGLWLDVCVIRCLLFKPKDIKTFSLLLYMLPFLFSDISLFSHILSFVQIVGEEEQNLS
jgi:hypothetical protein